MQVLIIFKINSWLLPIRLALFYFLFFNLTQVLCLRELVHINSWQNAVLRVKALKTDNDELMSPIGTDVLKSIFVVIITMKLKPKPHVSIICVGSFKMSLNYM